jgi:hypothetical protein
MLHKNLQWQVGVGKAGKHNRERGQERIGAHALNKARKHNRERGQKRIRAQTLNK